MLDSSETPTIEEIVQEKATFRTRIENLKGSLLGAFGLMMVAVTLASGLNYVFSIIMTRMLDETGSFASFNSLNAIYLIVTIGALSVQTVITKYVAEFEAVGQPEKTRLLLHRFTRWLLGTGGVILLVSVAVAWPLARVLDLSSPGLVIVLGFSVGITLYLTLPYGLLQGRQRFLALGGAAISVAILRIVFGVVLVAVGLGVFGALGAAGLAGLAVTGVVVYSAKEMFFGRVKQDASFNPAIALWALIPVGLAVFLLIFMTQIDVVLVKALKSAAVADLYSYAGLAGKAVLFFPEGVTLVMFPRVSAMRAGGEPAGKVLAWSMAAAAALVGAVVGFYALFPGFTATFFAGDNAERVKAIPGPAGFNFVAVFGLVMAVFALVKLVAFYLLALDRKAFIAVYAAGAVAEVVGISLFHGSLSQILVVMLCTGGALLLASLAFAARPERSTGSGAGYRAEQQLPMT